MKIAHAPMLVALLAAGGCALGHTYAKCGLDGCTGDAQINAHILELIARHADIFINDINVQTLDSTVYLYGLVDTNAQRAEIVEAAQSVAGADHVVDALVLRGDPGF